MVKYILAIIATEAIVEILVESELFDGVRVWIGQRHRLLDGLVSCPWCISVWVAGIVIALLYFGLWPILAFFAVHRLANFVHDCYGLIKRLGWKK